MMEWPEAVTIAAQMDEALRGRRTSAPIARTAYNLPSL